MTSHALIYHLSRAKEAEKGQGTPFLTHPNGVMVRKRSRISITPQKSDGLSVQADFDFDDLNNDVVNRKFWEASLDSSEKQMSKWQPPNANWGAQNSLTSNLELLQMALNLPSDAKRDHFRQQHKSS